MISRQREVETLKGLLKRHPIAGILGARQEGKTTLARNLVTALKKPTTYYDLENPEDLARLTDPMLDLKDRRGLVVIDEIQRFPDLFPVLRVLADRPRSDCRFLILGSASPACFARAPKRLQVGFITAN